MARRFFLSIHVYKMLCYEMSIKHKSFIHTSPSLYNNPTATPYDLEWAHFFSSVFPFRDFTKGRFPKADPLKGLNFDSRRTLH